MKKISLILSVVLLLTLCACGGNDNSDVPQDSSEVIEENSAAGENLLSASFSGVEGRGETAPELSFVLPDGFSLGDETNEIISVPGEFVARLPIVNFEGESVGYVAYNTFEAPTGGNVPADEEYYKAVWPGLRLSSFRVWDPFTAVRTDEYGQRGTVTIEYIAPEDAASSAVAGSEQLSADGVLAYDKEKLVYVGFAFLPDTINRDELTRLRQSVEIK